MNTKTKIMIGALAGTLTIAVGAFAVYKYLKGKKVCLVEGNDDDVVYFLLDSDETYDNGKKFKFSKKAM